MRLLQHTRYHKAVRAPYAAHFGRWLGRPLLKCEKRLITALEYRRLHGPTQALRCVVCAPYGEKILLSYLRYFAKHLYRNDTSAVIMPNAELAERRARLEVARDTFHSSGRSVDSLRGRDINATLILNAGRLNSYRETTREIYRRVNAVIAGVILELPHNCVIAHVEHYDEFIYFWLPVISLGDPRMCYLHDPPPLPENKLYTETEVPAPHAPDAQETAPPPTPHPPSHPPSAKRAATSAAKSQNGDKKPKSTLTH